MGAVFDDSNVYMLHMMYQAMGVCLYMQDPDGAIRYGEKIAKYYRCDHTDLKTAQSAAKVALQYCPVLFCTCRKLYPAYSLNLSSLYLKLGRLYFGMGRNAECMGMLKKVISAESSVKAEPNYPIMVTKQKEKLSSLEQKQNREILIC